LEEVECDICDQDETAVTLTATITIDGIGGVGPGCLACTTGFDCTVFNGTYVIDLTYDTDPEADADANCYFKFGEVLIDDTCSGFATDVVATITISEPDGSGNSIITLLVDQFTLEFQASYTVATPFDCSAFGPVSMTIDFATPTHTDCCDGSALTVQLSLSTA
jgi:hypothetical protein